MDDGTTGTVAVATDATVTPAEKLADRAPEIVRSEVLAALVLQCGACGALSGNGAGQIDEGEVVFNQKIRRYERRLLCKACGQKSRRPLLALEALDVMVDKLNAERDERIAATEAARAENAQKLEAAIAVWQSLANGRVKVRFEVGMDGEGNLLCGMAGCSYCGGKGPAKMFVVVKTAKGWETVGLCIHQGAARRESKVSWGRIPWGSYEVCEAEAKKRQDALNFFLDLWAGKAERPKLVQDERGRLLCGVPGCTCKEPAELGLVSEKRLDKVGLCLPHAIAGRAANRQGARFFIDALADCDPYLNVLERTIAQFAHRLEGGNRFSRRPERPAKTRVLETTPASERARAKNAALAQALREGQGLAAVVQPKSGDPIAEAAAAGDSVAAQIQAHNDAQDAQDVARRAKRKGGGNKPNKGGRKHRD